MRRSVHVGEGACVQGSRWRALTSATNAKGNGDGDHRRDQGGCCLDASGDRFTDSPAACDGPDYRPRLAQRDRQRGPSGLTFEVGELGIHRLYLAAYSGQLPLHLEKFAHLARAAEKRSQAGLLGSQIPQACLQVDGLLGDIAC